MKIIDKVLQNAFRLMRMREDSSAAMAKKLGISGAHMTRILKGKTNYLSDETWARIEPIITPYIRTDAIRAFAAPAIPPEVIDRIMSSAAPAEEKAAVIRELFAPRFPEKRELPSKNILVAMTEDKTNGLA